MAPSFDYECLATLVARLGTQPTRTFAADPACPRRASVALLLRVIPGPTHVSTASVPNEPPDAATAPTPSLDEFLQDPHVRQGTLELLYIERARSQRDRWSGQIAFPGGRREPGETDQGAAERETREEIDLDVTAGDHRHAICLTVLYGEGFLTIKVYLQLSQHTPALSPQPGEVASVHWIGLDQLLCHLPCYTGPEGVVVQQPLDWNPVTIDIASRLASSGWRQRHPWLTRLLRLVTGNVSYHCLSLATTHPPVVAKATTANDAATFLPSAFVTANQHLRLWGLTLRMTSDLVDLMFPGHASPLPSLAGPLPQFSICEVSLLMRLWLRINTGFFCSRPSVFSG
ncbi:hypothetical protein H4R34_000206 [Dimargaris verticillata]|uniref:Nudix hydrolase domain-containing protein n=1 Tax=Dimargaris verticillata TaxID=2761393 RepID=A0A9W8EC30_9FUNG|nr:hypothetical protein H4R34_000206 [Dimargaris verticillata]